MVWPSIGLLGLEIAEGSLSKDNANHWSSWCLQHASPLPRLDSKLVRRRRILRVKSELGNCPAILASQTSNVIAKRVRCEANCPELCIHCSAPANFCFPCHSFSSLSAPQSLPSIIQGWYSRPINTRSNSGLGSIPVPYINKMNTYYVPEQLTFPFPLPHLYPHFLETCISYVRLEVFTAVTMKNAVSWDIKTRFLPHRRHITSPLPSPAG
jgi:hypothetical protein